MLQEVVEKKVSYSKLSTYLECPELYRLKYVKKERGEGLTIVEPLIKGTLAHSCIENYLRGLDKEDAVQIALGAWLKETCGLEANSVDIQAKKNVVVESVYDDFDMDGLFDDNIASASSIIDIDMLYTFAVECGRLLHRCSESYKEKDKIRNKDGSAPKNPLEYPPGEFTKEYNFKDLALKKTEIDQRAAKQHRAFTRMSLANIAAEAISYLFIFEVPEEVDSVEKIEFKLDTEKVWFGKDRDIYWNGLIDTEYLTKDGEIIINDHKTEKYKRRPEDVAFDLQLNSYAAVRYEQSSKLPEKIAITHLGTNSLLTADTDIDILTDSMEYLEGIQAEIDKDIKLKGVETPWFKKWPAKYGSPCIRRKFDALEQVCPYLRKCWPMYAESIKDELNEFLD